MIERFDPLKGERLRVLDEDGRAAPDLDPGLSDAAAPGPLRAHGPDAGRRRQGRQAPAPGPARHLRPEPRPRGRAGRPGLGHDRRRLVLPLFPGSRRVPHARLSPGRLLPFLDGPRGRAAHARRAEHLPHRHPRRLADPPGRRGGHRRQVPQAPGRRRHDVRGRRDLRGRLPRGAQFRRRFPDAQRLRLLQQPVRHLRAALAPDGGRDHRPEGPRLRLPRRPGRRQRRPGRLRRGPRGPGDRPERRRADPHRGLHLPAGRPHDLGRRRPLPDQGGGPGVGPEGPDPPLQAPSGPQGALGRGLWRRRSRPRPRSPSRKPWPRPRPGRRRRSTTSSPYTYAAMPPDLEIQRAELKASLPEGRR